MTDWAGARHCSSVIHDKVWAVIGISGLYFVWIFTRYEALG